jgi:hypothetical protein
MVVGDRMRIIFVVLIMIAFSMGVHACSVPSNDIVDNSTSEDGPVKVVEPDDVSDTTGGEQGAVDGGSDIIDKPEIVELPAGETSENIHHSHGYGEAHIRDLLKNETSSEQNVASGIESKNSMEKSSLAAQNRESNASSVAIVVGGIVLCAGAIHYITKR